MPIHIRSNTSPATTLCAPYRRWRQDDATFEDPERATCSDCRVARGLTKRAAKGLRRKDDATLAAHVFSDTTRGRMLRMLMVVGEMPCTEFMRYVSKLQGVKNGLTFWNLFGRFISEVDDLRWAPVASGGTERVVRRLSGLNNAWGCIAKHGDPRKRSEVVVKWTRGDFVSFLGAMTDAELQDAFESMERQMLTPRPTDVQMSVRATTWLQAIREEIDRRSVRTTAPVRHDDKKAS